jgi:glycosyltransferase involved in cell wall biosynthesis
LFTSLRLIDRGRIEPLLLLPRRGPILEEINARGLRHVEWGPLTEPGNPLAYAKAYFRALRFFRREQVAGIHINNYSGFWRPAELLAARTLRIPILVHYHVVNGKVAPFMRLCTAAICVSRYTAEHSLPDGMQRPVIYNPVDLGRFDSGRSLRADLGLGPDDIVVSFLGQIREIKGVQDFIAMARRISDPRARFLIAGQCRDPVKFAGSYSEQDLVQMSGGDTRIRYIGYVREVENVYHTSDIVVVPSRWQEPLGLINLEAGACSKPVVATRVGGIPEIVHEGVNGYLVDAGDVAGLAERVGALIAAPDQRKRMGEAGRRQVESQFTTLPVREFEALLLDYGRRH